MIPEPPVDPPEWHAPSPLPYRMSPAHCCPRWCNPNDPCASCEEHINRKEPVMHTPGPWKVNRNVPYGFQAIIAEDRQGFGTAVAAVSMRLTEGESPTLEVNTRLYYEAEANARLLAAAPDLLAALVEMTEAFAVAGTNPGRHAALAQALAAIERTRS